MGMDQFCTASRQVWEKMAEGWDANREYLWESSKPVGEWLVRKLDPKPGQSVLELAAGMGDTGFVAAQLLGPGGRLLSTDFASSMVEGARRRAEELGITNVEFRTMNAQRMDLDDQSFDGVLCRWGFMLMSDPGAAFEETRRVLKPHGRLCFSVFAEPERNPWAALPAKAMIDAGFMEPPQPNSPGIFGLADRNRLERLLEQAGFSDTEIEEVPLTWRHADFDNYWAFLTGVAGAIATLIEALPPDGQEGARQAIERAIAPFNNDGDGITFPGVTLNVAARI